MPAIDSFLPELVRVANANASRMPYGRDFYRIKDRLLTEFGERVGEDVQHLTDQCWGCYGSGRLPAIVAAAYPSPCPNCRGTGIYMERFILLERWTLGSLVFHRPVGLTSRRDEMIRGYIKHEGVEYNASLRAFLSLAILYEPRLAKGIVGCQGMDPREWWPGKAQGVAA